MRDGSGAGAQTSIRRTVAGSTFALAVRLSVQWHFTWKARAAALVDELKSDAGRGEPDDGSHLLHGLPFVGLCAKHLVGNQLLGAGPRSRKDIVDRFAALPLLVPDRQDYH